MKTRSYAKFKCPVLLVAGLGGFFTIVNLACATVRYVDVNSPTLTPPPPDTNAAGPGPFFYRVGVQP